MYKYILWYSRCVCLVLRMRHRRQFVGSFEDTFNYVDDHGVRRGYGYELMQALAGYTG